VRASRLRITRGAGGRTTRERRRKKKRRRREDGKREEQEGSQVVPLLYLDGAIYGPPAPLTHPPHN
jgi:hypothetical protein